MPRQSSPLSPLATTFYNYCFGSDDMTPTPTSPQAEHSPQLITPQVKLVKPKSKSPPRSKIIKEEATSPKTRLPPISMVSADTSTRLQTKLFNQGGHISPSAISPKAKPPSPDRERKTMPVRRQSRFDPMIASDNEEMMEDEGYGDLGLKHPLRRVKEEEGTKDNKITPPESITLPPIKSLFGVASDHTQSPASSSLFQSPSLPSLIPNSPSGSPSSARTSRYSSLASSAVPENSAGWWAPEFEKGSSPFQPTPYRSNSFPTIPYVSDETGQKRRRSDGPPALRDAEESARLRWQAQSRNASFPMATSPAPPSAGPSNSSSGLRGLLHPPQASSAGVSASMSRSSLSGSTTGGRLSPTLEDEPLPFSRRPSQASRNPSLVGGQLSSHFAGLSASDRDKPVSSEMPPPLQTAPPERRGSAMLPPLAAMDDSNNRLFPPPSSLSRSASPASDIMRKQSLTRPPSPEMTGRPELRRSSLTEIIMQKSGDMNMGLTANSNNRFGPSHPHANELGLATSVSMDKSSFSEPVPPLHHTIQSAPPWATRRESTDSVKSSHEFESGPGPSLSLRGRKRSVVETRQNQLDEDAEMSTAGGGDPGMRGMEVLLAAAAVEEERKVRKSSEEDEDEPLMKLNNGNGSATGGANGGPKYTCAFCAKTFSRPSSLRIHTYSHTGERPYVCKEPTCRRRFSVQSNLKRHAKVHQLGAAAGLQQSNGHGHGHPHPHGPPGLPMHPHGQGHPIHPGMPRAPHSHPGTVTQGPGPGPMYHPGPPPPGYYPPPPPGYVQPHPHHAPHFGGPPGPPGAPGYGPPPPHIAMGMQQSQAPGPGPGPGWRSISSSRRTSRDEDVSEGEEEVEGEEDEEIDELEEDD
ncbi:uncharacterized protein L199_006087 [Kwoniella botswanensis]|uniref:uncharacterized protein n=1 Tax=Kwoniella botswanensis TaxID=1268659 RepID=UPI00315C59F3